MLVKGGWGGAVGVVMLGEVLGDVCGAVDGTGTYSGSFGIVGGGCGGAFPAGLGRRLEEVTWAGDGSGCADRPGEFGHGGGKAGRHGGCLGCWVRRRAGRSLVGSYVCSCSWEGGVAFGVLGVAKAQFDAKNQGDEMVNVMREGEGWRAEMKTVGEQERWYTEGGGEGGFSI